MLKSKPLYEVKIRININESAKFLRASILLILSVSEVKTPQSILRLKHR